MREVMDDCKVCGKPMLTNSSPLIHRTCAARKAEQRRESNRRLAVRRKPSAMPPRSQCVPRCQQCGKPIEGGNWLNFHWNTKQWARRFCGSTCRQAAFRAGRRSDTTSVS